MKFILLIFALIILSSCSNAIEVPTEFVIETTHFTRSPIILESKIDSIKIDSIKGL